MDNLPYERGILTSTQGTRSTHCSSLAASTKTRLHAGENECFLGAGKLCFPRESARFLQILQGVPLALTYEVPPT